MAEIAEKLALERYALFDVNRQQAEKFKADADDIAFLEGIELSTKD